MREKNLYKLSYHIKNNLCKSVLSHQLDEVIVFCHVNVGLHFNRVGIKVHVDFRLGSHREIIGMSEKF